MANDSAHPDDQPGEPEPVTEADYKLAEQVTIGLTAADFALLLGVLQVGDLGIALTVAVALVSAGLPMSVAAWTQFDNAYRTGVELYPVWLIVINGALTAGAIVAVLWHFHWALVLPLAVVSAILLLRPMPRPQAQL